MTRQPLAPVVLLERDTVPALLDLDTCIAAVENAFAAHTNGLAFKTGLLHVDVDDGEFHIKAGGLRGEPPYFPCKINGSFFQNRARYGLPNINGVILLSDAHTGLPLAILESSWITRARTAAATAVAAKYLARRDSRTVTTCGAGAQAEIQLRALARMFKLEKIFVWSRGTPAPFAERMSRELSMEVEATGDLRTACRNSEIIVTCTASTHWFLALEHISPGAFIAAVGADTPTKQELDPRLVAAASVGCDLAGQCAHVGELHHAVDAGLMTADQIRGELGDVIVGKALARRSDDEIIVFDSTGTALQDVATAIAVYERHQATAKSA